MSAKCGLKAANLWQVFGRFVRSVAVDGEFVRSWQVSKNACSEINLGAIILSA